MKKTVSVTLSFILILSMIMSTFLFVSAPANADSENVVTGSCGEKVTYSLNKDTGVLTISGTGEMNDYAWSKSPFFNSGDIKTVVIEKGVTKIGQYVFDSCYELTKVTIPDSLETIGRYAFYYCEKLPKIHINKVATLDTGAFQGCSSLKYFICGKSLTNIEDMAFSGCTALHYIFYEGTQTEFKNISVGSSNSNFTSGVSRYDKMIFTSDYMGFYITGENDDEVSLEWYLGDKTVIEIPAVFGEYPVTTLYYAFSDNDNITSVTIPDSVTAITGIAFCDCEKLESVTIGKNVKTIGDNAFMNCISLKSITIPDGVTSLGEEVFSRCESLKSVIISDSVTSLGAKAFSGCSLLENVKIGNGVTELKDAAFYNCEKLTNVTIGSSVTSIGVDAFYYCTSLKDIAIPNKVESIGDYAFCSCQALERVSIPDSLTTLGTDVFSYTNDSFTVTAGCKHPLVQDIISGTERKWVKVHANDEGLITKKANCKETGEIIYTCKVCGEKTTSILPMTEDHKWDAGTVTKAATCTEKGTKVFVCAYGCGASKTEEIPALGHDFSGGVQYCKRGCGTKNPKFNAADPANKLANTLTVKGKTVTIKSADLSKKNITIAAKKAVKVKKAQGKVTYKKKSGDKKITVNRKTGKITVKKGLKKGTYKVKIKVTASGDDSYNSATGTVKVTIKIA